VTRRWRRQIAGEATTGPLHYTVDAAHLIEPEIAHATKDNVLSRH